MGGHRLTSYVIKILGFAHESKHAPANCTILSTLLRLIATLLAMTIAVLTRCLFAVPAIWRDTAKASNNLILKDFSYCARSASPDEGNMSDIMCGCVNCAGHDAEGGVR